MRALLVALLIFCSPCWAGQFKGEGYERYLAKDYAPTEAVDWKPIDGHKKLYARATEVRKTGLSDAGDWVQKHIDYGRPIIAEEANLIGREALRGLLEAPDVAKTPLPAGDLVMVESREAGQSALFTNDGKFLAFSEGKKLPVVEQPRPPPTLGEGGFVAAGDIAARVARLLDRIGFSRAAEYINKKLGPPRTSIEAPTKPDYGNYRIINDDVFAKSTVLEEGLAIRAKAVHPEIAGRLRADGFIPINELAGGTPYRWNRYYEGWVMPETDGVHTFPETD